MGIDYSDIINGIWLFLLFGLSATSIFINLSLLTERAYLKRIINRYRVKDLTQK